MRIILIGLLLATVTLSPALADNAWNKFWNHPDWRPLVMDDLQQADPVVPPPSALQAGFAAIPLGDYQRTCRDCAMDDGVLSCRCFTDDWELRHTNIVPQQCAHDGLNIINFAGQLRCGPF